MPVIWLYFIISSRSELASLDCSLWQALTKILLIPGTCHYCGKLNPAAKPDTVLFSPEKTVLLSNEKISHATTGPFPLYIFNHSQLFRSRVTSAGIFDVLRLIAAVTTKAALHNLREERYVLGITHRSKMFHFFLGC